MTPYLEIQLLCIDELCKDAFDSAVQKHHLSDMIKVTHHSCALAQVPPMNKFDLIVSPANSYGRLDGGFDDAISRAYAPKDDYLALTRVAQSTLYKEWHGFAPPGTCTLVRIPDEFQERSRNVWETKYIGLCPTMRVPQNVCWDREVVYECIWSLLCAIDKHNRSITETEGASNTPIRSILMTPLATGTGFVSPERWAQQVVLSINHFMDSLNNPAKWGSLGWPDIRNATHETGKTWK